MHLRLVEVWAEELMSDELDADAHLGNIPFWNEKSEASIVMTWMVTI